MTDKCRRWKYRSERAGGNVNDLESDRNWSVTVEANGRRIIMISSHDLCGKDNLSDADKSVIREAAENLLAFVGADYSSDS